MIHYDKGFEMKKNKINISTSLLLCIGIFLYVSNAYAEKEGVLGKAFFQELRARAQSAFDELEERIDDEFENFDEEDEPAHHQAKVEKAKQEHTQAHLQQEATRRHEIQEENKRRIEAQERARALEAERLSEAQRNAQKRAAQVKASQARRAQERATRAGYEIGTKSPTPQPQEQPLQRKRMVEPSSGQFEARILELANQERARGGDCGGVSFDPAPPLHANGKLAVAAQKHAQDMEQRRFFDHRDPQGVGPKERIDEQGYQGRAWGENIAAGQRSPESVMRAWMKSPGHCKNILNPLFNELGVGIILNAQGPYRTYWVQNFGRS